MDTLAPVLSVIIPAHNRVGPLRETLASVQAAAVATPTEIILVDDGSDSPLAEQLSQPAGPAPCQFLRQPNSGPIVARLNGLKAARGKYVLFLDSDDLVHPDKFSLAVEKLESEEAEIVYDDMARATRSGATWTFEPAEALKRAQDSADFFLKVQPVPHSPIYRRSYLLLHLEKPLFAPIRVFDPAGDVWLYYNLCVFPAKIVKLERALTAIGIHSEDRFSRQWEKLAVSSLGIMEAFAKACPLLTDLLAVRITAGECAFDSWRRLPKGYNPEFTERMWRLWKKAPHGSVEKLGGRFFQRLAKLFGATGAGRLLRLRNSPYRDVRTATSKEVNDWLSKLP